MSGVGGGGGGGKWGQCDFFLFGGRQKMNVIFIVENGGQMPHAPLPNVIFFLGGRQKIYIIFILESGGKMPHAPSPMIFFFWGGGGEADRIFT